MPARSPSAPWSKKDSQKFNNAVSSLLEYVGFFQNCATPPPLFPELGQIQPVLDHVLLLLPCDFKAWAQCPHAAAGDSLPPQRLLMLWGNRHWHANANMIKRGPAGGGHGEEVQAPRSPRASQSLHGKRIKRNEGVSSGVITLHTVPYGNSSSKCMAHHDTPTGHRKAQLANRAACPRHRVRETRGGRPPLCRPGF